LARYDKYDPISGGYRALAGEVFGPGIWGVRINASGKMIKSGAANGVDGVFCNPGPLDVPINEPIDVMTRGQVVEFSGGIAGTDYYADVAGAITATVGTNVKIGVTVEADRLIILV
jgi:hypothetical protein